MYYWKGFNWWHIYTIINVTAIFSHLWLHQHYYFCYTYTFHLIDIHVIPAMQHEVQSFSYSSCRCPPVGHEAEGGGPSVPFHPWLHHYWGPTVAECESNNQIMHGTLEDMGLPAEPVKDEGPATAISFTGIEIDTIAWKYSLPQEKKHSWGAGGWKTGQKWELLSLMVSHVQGGEVREAFLRRLIDLSIGTQWLDQFVRLNQIRHM